jgi:hypothetical protein
MLRKKIIMGGVLVIAAVYLLSGCYKDKTVIFDTGENITRPVNFSSDIISIFNSSCNFSGCHGSGGKSPDLSTNSAFLSLTNGNYINTGNPQNSVLYLWMAGKKTTPMPVGGINKEYNALVLAWIKQGAQNN